MNYSITMPSLGADMTEGKLLNWRIKVGDRIKRGQIIADIETQKAAVEMENFKDGVVTSIKAIPLEIIPVGGLMAELELAEEMPVHTMTLKQPSVPRASPAAKNLASEKGIDWKTLKGTGPNGVIELVDVESALPKTEGPKATSEPFINVRKAIAAAMSKSKKEIPHYYLKMTADMDSLLLKLDALNERRPLEQKILLPALLAKIVSDTLKEFPNFNGYFIQDKFEAKPNINLGIVISLKNNGVIVPALLETETKDLSTLAVEFNDLIDRARNQKLRSRELSDSTFTITNLGDLGVEEVFGVIFPPQVGILGIGRVYQAPVIRDGQLLAGHRATFTLSGDHRVSDGIMGSRFLQILKSKIERNLFSDKD